MPGINSAISSRPLRIGIDAHAIGSRLGGNETYILDVLSALESHREHEYFVYATDAKAASRARAAMPSAKSIGLIGHANPILRLGFRLSALCAKDKIDVLHVQYVAPPVSPKIVQSIHDLSFEHHPEWYARVEGARLRSTVRWTARRAKRILTISEYSRTDIIETLGVSESRVSFSHLRLRPIFTPRSRDEIAPLLSRFGISGSYVLALGNLQPRKNLQRLIRAWTDLRRTAESFAPKLVIVGRKAWDFDPVFAAAKQSEFANDVIFTDYVAAEELPGLLSGATIFAYPSLFEGFGYPPLEAMGCGAPVLTSNVTSLPEICGDAAVYADPENTDDIAEKLLHLYRDDARRSELTNLGLKRADEYRNVDLAGVLVRAYEGAAEA